MNRLIKRILVVFFGALFLIFTFVVITLFQHKKNYFDSAALGSLWHSEDIEVFIDSNDERYSLSESQIEEITDLIKALDVEPAFGWRDKDVVDCAINFDLKNDTVIYRIDIESSGNRLVARLQRKGEIWTFHYDAYQASDLARKLDEYSDRNCLKRRKS